MTRGGARAGAGRPKANTVIYYRRVKPEWVQELDNKIEDLKMKEKILEIEQKLLNTPSEPDEFFRDRNNVKNIIAELARLEVPEADKLWQKAWEGVNYESTHLMGKFNHAMKYIKLLKEIL